MSERAKPVARLLLDRLIDRQTVSELVSDCYAASRRFEVHYILIQIKLYGSHIQHSFLFYCAPIHHRILKDRSCSLY